MVGNKNLGNASIINAECVALRDRVLSAKPNFFSTWRLQKDFKVIIDCYDKKNSLPSSIILLMEDIWGLARNLNIFSCCHIYK